MTNIIQQGMDDTYFRSTDRIRWTCICRDCQKPHSRSNGSYPFHKQLIYCISIEEKE